MAYWSLTRLARGLALALATLAGAGSAVAAPGIEELPVPKITIYPGDAIRQEMITAKRFRMSADPLPVARTLDPLIGKVARRTLVAGKPIPLSYVRDPDVVEKGKPVRIVFASGGLEISSIAIPLQAGGIGDELSLRNPESGVIIRGVVNPDGTIRVAGP